MTATAGTAETDEFEQLQLTCAQTGVWYAHQLDRSQRAYNVVSCTEFAGAVDGPALATAIARAENECRTFQTQPVSGPDGPVQVTVPSDGPQLRFIDLSGEADPAAAGVKWMRRDAKVAFDLERDDLNTDVLLTLGGSRHTWYSRCHHILMDGYSANLFNQRVAGLYSAIATGLQEAGRPLDTVRALVEDEASYLAGSQYRADARYWTERFCDVPAPVSLGRPGAPAAGGDPLRTTHRLGPEQVARLDAAARRARVPWTVVVIGAVGTYLREASGQSEVTLGVPVTARRTPVALNAPGMVSNQLPLRMCLEGSSPTEQLRAVARPLGELLVHQRYPSEHLSRELRLLKRRRQLFSVSVNLLPHQRSPQFAGVPATSRSLSIGPVDDLSIAVSGHGGAGVRLEFSANAALHDAADLAEHQVGILRHLAAFFR